MTEGTRTMLWDVDVVHAEDPAAGAMVVVKVTLYRQMRRDEFRGLRLSPRDAVTLTWATCGGST